MPAILNGDDDAIANQGSEFPDPIALCSGDDLGAIDSRKKADIAVAVRHEIIGERTQQGESTTGIPSHRSRGIQDKCFCHRI